MPTIADYLNFANLQMAAEAFLVDQSGNLITRSNRGLTPIDVLLLQHTSESLRER